jgi:hypothetical protein
MTIHVIGKGESKEFFKHDGNVTIGVNDVNRWIETDHIVMVDPVHESMRNVLITTSAKFWSQLESNSIYVKHFNKIDLARGRGVLDEFDSDRFVYSITSPFVAVHLAYKLGAKNIVMWGVDFNTHPNFDTDSLRNRALKDFGNLRKKLNERGVNFYVGNEMSMFSSILPILESLHN